MTAPNLDTARARLPRQRDVLLAQVRAIGFALRIPMMVAAGLAMVVAVVIGVQIVTDDIRGSLLAEPSATPGVIGALLGIAVWLREERFGPGYLWTLPVDRSRHALIKALAGWLWLMAGVALYALGLVVLSLISGGGAVPVETLHVLTVDVPRSSPIDLALVRTVQWAPGALIWAVPFGGATATYLLASAFMLGARRPLRWAVGALLLVPISSGVSHVAGRLLGVLWLADLPERVMQTVGEGRYGFDTLLKLRTWTLDRGARLPNGDRIEVWTELPDLADWRIAALLWISAGLLALAAAAYQHRERRRR